MELTGYIRSDGSVGFRNLVAVVPLTGCAQRIVTRIADQVDGATAFFQPLGCDLVGPDQDRLGLMLYRLATNPNVGAALFVTLGCAYANEHELDKRVAETRRPTKLLNIQKTGGTTATVQAGVAAAQGLADQLKKQQRQPVPVSSIILGTKCGASDKTSYEVCNPAVGVVTDRLVELGASVVLSEDCELYMGTEDLAARAVDDQTIRRIREMAQNLKKRATARGYDIEANYADPEAGRKMSLDRIAKAGTKPIQKVVRLGELVDTPGLVVLDGPNSDLACITSLAAAGCNLLIFTTGIGTLIASPVAPTIKVCANQKTYERMCENIDVLVTRDDLGSADRILGRILAYANGEPTKGETADQGEMFIPLEGIIF
jgi:altronate dehydratase large subunit